jgi:NADH:ubiquinone oxidoreductase subunit 6 (subunit J)
MRWQPVLKALSVVLLALLIILSILSASWPEEDMDEFDNTSEELGRTLFGTTDATGYGLIVFFIGLLLLVALLGGIFLAKEERE